MTPSLVNQDCVKTTLPIDQDCVQTTLPMDQDCVVTPSSMDQDSDSIILRKNYQRILNTEIRALEQRVIDNQKITNKNSNKELNKTQGILDQKKRKFVRNLL